MNWRISTGALLWVSFLLVLALSISATWFFHGQKELPSPSGSYIPRLRIERPGKTHPAPAFTLEDLSGKSTSLRGLKGKVIFLNFWATWCVPCREEMPAMERLHREFKREGLEVVAVNYREDKDDVRKFLQELGLTFTVLLDKDGKVSEDYGVWSLPLSYFVNRRGEFVGKAIGSRDWNGQDARAFFQPLLAEKP
jgi:DsbE subfamily thiol:disulfide oxidoreductase